MVWDVTAEVNHVPLPRWLDTVHRPQRRTDERQIRGVGGERGSQLRVDGRGAHPDLELRRAGGGGVEVDGRAGFPRDQVERDFDGRGRGPRGTSSTVWCSGPSSGACMQIDEVATTPRLCRAVMVRWRRIDPRGGGWLGIGWVRRPGPRG